MEEKKAGQGKGKFKKTLLVVVGISIAIHLLLLLLFGGVTLFRGSVPKLPFVSQEIPAEAVADSAGPPAEEAPAPVEEPVQETSWQPPAESAPSESAPPTEILTVTGGANWPPALPKSVPVAETGAIGGISKGSGPGSVQGSGGPVSGKQLFGVSVQAKKLGVIADVSGSMQPKIPRVMEEIFRNFPDADVVFVNGCGMMEWNDALKKYQEEREKPASGGKPKFSGPAVMPKPQLVKFSSPEAADSPPIRGTGFFGGFRKDYPDWYEKLRQRPNTWFITGYVNGYPTAMAFEHLARRKVEAIYWFSDFADPVEGRAAEEAARLVLDNRIEVFLHSAETLGKARAWSKKVNAQVISRRL